MNTSLYIHRMTVFDAWAATDWIGLTGLIVAVAALSVAAVLAYLEIRRYRIPLQMRVREVEIAAQANGHCYLALLKVAFVNPATRGRTVYHLAVHQSDEVHVGEPQYEYSEQHDAITYKLPDGMQDGDATLSLDEVIQLPLDIPPHQSRYLWLPAVVRLQIVRPGSGVPKFRLTLDANDVLGYRLVVFDEEIELWSYMIS